MGLMDRDYVRQAPRWHMREHGEQAPTYSQYNDAMATAQRLAARRMRGTTRRPGEPVSWGGAIGVIALLAAVAFLTFMALQVF